MDLVHVRCSPCDALLGSLINVWASISKHFITPLRNPENATSSFHISLSGSARTGQSNTFIDSCRVQNIACLSCNRQLGIKCLSAPPNHRAMARGQLVFDKSCVRLRSTVDSGREVEPFVKREVDMTTQKEGSPEKPPASSSKGTAGGKFPRFEHLNSEQFDSFGKYSAFWGPSGSAAAGKSTEVTRLQREMADQKAIVQTIMTNGPKKVTQLEASLARVNGSARRLEQELLEVRHRVELQKAEIDALKLELASEKQERGMLSDVQHSIVITRADVALLGKEFSTTQQDLRSVVRENVQLRKDYNKLRAESNHEKDGVEDFTSEVSGLRKEMKQLKAELAEQRKASARKRTRDDDSLSRLDSNVQRKRTADEAEDIDKTPKRRTVTPGASASQQSTPSTDRTLWRLPASPIPLKKPVVEDLAEVSPSKSIVSAYTDDGNEMELVQCP